MQKFTTIISLVFCLCNSMAFADTQANAQNLEATHSSTPASQPVNLQELLFHISQFYVSPTDNDQLQQAAVAAIFKQLDPYSDYLDEQELSALFNMSNGEYTGLGIEVEQRGEHVVIVRPLPGSPADVAGISAGDIILKVNQQSTKGMDLNRVSKLISEHQNQPVTLEVTRIGSAATLAFQITPQAIILQSVESQMLADGQIAYVKINNFSSHTAQDVQQQLHALGDFSQLIIDVRDNPGGVLEAAVKTADLFLDRGIIVSTKGRFQEANHRYLAQQGDISHGAKIAVLINKNSASAAEILAAALQENQRAVLIGVQSYGKGSVQSLIPLGDGRTAIKLTTALYYTPSGQTIHGKGISPDFFVEQSTLSNDTKSQLQQDDSLKQRLLTMVSEDKQLDFAQQYIQQ